MKKILVIDDADFILESTSTLLEFEGYEIHTASDGTIGVEKAFEISPDLILCDISMPGMDGYEVLNKIRQSKETKRTPFIFLTAFNEKSNMREGMEKGADDYLVKPYNRDELVAAINAQWQKYNVIQEHVKSKVEEVGKSITYVLPHEFRTAINQIKGSAGILNKSSSHLNEDDICSISSDIIESVNRLSKITENYLTYIKINSIEGDEDKKADLKKGKTEEPFAAASDILSNKASKYDRFDDLVLSEDEQLSDFSINFFSENFFKIVDEIADNAFRFSDKGTKVYLDGNLNEDTFTLEIKDEGIGMSKEQINSIAALTQFDRKINEQQGVGLGLFIAKRLVEIHEGEFNIESKEKEGTRIKLNIPIADSSD